MVRKAFTRRGSEEKIQEAAAAENTRGPREASKVPTEANKDTVAEEVPEVVAAEKPGVPMEASKLPTEAKKGTEAEEVAGVVAHIGRCRRYKEEGKNNTHCPKIATVQPHYGKNKHVIYCQECHEITQEKTGKERKKAGAKK